MEWAARHFLQRSSGKGGREGQGKAQDWDSGGPGEALGRRLPSCEVTPNKLLSHQSLSFLICQMRLSSPSQEVPVKGQMETIFCKDPAL